MPDPISATIGAVSTIGGAAISSNAASKAGKTQAKAADEAAKAQLEMYYQSRDDMAPYRSTGKRALNQLAALQGIGTPAGSIGFLTQTTPDDKRTKALEQFQASPGYQFRREQGLDAIQNSAAARGVLGSGNTLKAIQSYGDGLASQEFESYSNRLAALAGVGQTATSNTAALGANAATGAGVALQNAGAARASGYAGQANAISGGLNQLGHLGGYMNWGGGGGGSTASPQFNLSTLYR